MPQAHKGGALAALTREWGIPRERVIAVGDNTIDLTMIQWAGLGVAVANAVERLKQAADLIAPSNDDDGVAWVIQNYLL
jgi:hydroxymethylpyrimidine pyrophosphatase-like HAD family hydrolase